MTTRTFRSARFGLSIAATTLWLGAGCGTPGGTTPGCTESCDAAQAPSDCGTCSNGTSDGGGGNVGDMPPGSSPDMPPGPPVPVTMIPEDRLAAWAGNVGVEGGIPARTTLVNCTSAPYSAHADGSNTAAQIQACLNGTPKDQVAYLPAGTYTLTSELSIPSNKTLRGANASTTILVFNNTDRGNIQINGDYTDASSGGGVVINSGYTKGSTQLTLASAAGYAVGNHVYLAELNDTSIPVAISNDNGACDYCGLYGTDGKRARIQLAKVTAVSGNTITISPPMLFSFTSGNDPKAYRTPAYVEFAGIESLTVKNAPGNNTTNILLQGAANSWVKNVKAETCGPRCVDVWDDVYRNEVRDSLFTGCIEQTQSDSCYAVEIFSGTGNLVENNLFVNTANGVITVSASGNVIAYNYMHGVHRLQSVTDWFWPDNWTHGAHSSYDLWEGNDTTALEWDEYWGSNSHDLSFRNRFRGKDETVSYDVPNLSANGAIITHVHQNYMTDVGNVLGTTGFNESYERTDGAGRPIWSTFENSAGISSTKARTTKLRHMNYDYFTNSVKRCGDPGEPGCQGGDGSETLPASLYLAGKPSWFGTSLWPPIGPDVAGYATANPAMRCYQNTIVKGVAFDSSGCY